MRMRNSIGICLVIALAGLLYGVHTKTLKKITLGGEAIKPATEEVGKEPEIIKDTRKISRNDAKLFFIALNDAGTKGMRIGCDDSIVGIESKNKNITPETILTELFSYEGVRTVDAGLYNALYQSNLRVDSVEVEGDVATVYISGEYSMGGVCDSPRFEAQVTQTLKQFVGIEKVRIMINGKEFSGSEK